MGDGEKKERKNHGQTTSRRLVTPDVCPSLSSVSCGRPTPLPLARPEWLLSSLTCPSGPLSVFFLLSVLAGPSLSSR